MLNDSSHTQRLTVYRHQSLDKTLNKTDMWARVCLEVEVEVNNCCYPVGIITSYHLNHILASLFSLNVKTYLNKAITSTPVHSKTVSETDNQPETTHSPAIKH